MPPRKYSPSSMNRCYNHLTIKCKNPKILQNMLDSFECYSNQQLTIINTTSNNMKCVFITSWYPDFDMLEELVSTHGCWLKNEWREDGGMRGVWVGYKDGTLHIKKLEWLEIPDDCL
jgi:hypothetical protein